MDSSLIHLQQIAEADGRECVVGALIFNDQGQVLAMKRSMTRRLFPGCWDIIGGHVEPGETLVEALARETYEETGWSLRRIIGLVEVLDWEAPQAGVVRHKREFDFLVEVEGDLAHPRIEVDKFSEYRWIDPSALDVLRENRAAGDWTIYHLVKKTLALTPGRYAA